MTTPEHPIDLSPAAAATRVATFLAERGGQLVVFGDTAPGLARDLQTLITRTERRTRTGVLLARTRAERNELQEALSNLVDDSVGAPLTVAA